MLKIIKILLAIIVILALTGGAVQFQSTEQGWGLMVDKKMALSSVKNGAVKIYGFVKSLAVGDAAETVDLKNEQQDAKSSLIK